MPPGARILGAIRILALTISVRVRATAVCTTKLRNRPWLSPLPSQSHGATDMNLPACVQVRCVPASIRADAVDSYDTHLFGNLGDVLFTNDDFRFLHGP